MKKYIQHIAASLLALSALVGCTPQARQLADVPTAQHAAASVPRFEQPKGQKVEESKKLKHSNIQASKHSQDATLVGSNRVTAAAPAIVAADNVSLIIDSGAVGSDVDISILATTEEHSGAIPEHLANLTADGAVYRMLPDGQQFQRDITIAMRYDSTALPYGYTADDIYTFFFNEQTGLWQQVERDSVDSRNQIVYSRTNHFTDYINGVLKVPESSDAMSYTPTTIKDLKAADPMEGITLIAPPEANNQGTANLSYPLTLPAGRHGMQPQLSVNYSSAGGSSILGLGWSLPVSEISVETRWGVPLFDAADQTEGYLLDGTTLVTSHIDEDGHMRLDKPVYHRDYQPRDLSGVTRFYPRVEGSFRRIERHKTSPDTYYWIVTEKDGTRHIYGSTNQSRLTDRKGNIVKWMLEKTIDTYGNTVLYNYVKRYAYNNGERPGEQLCLSRIYYTGHEPSGDGGKYCVRLYYVDKQDKSSSFRYGMEEINNSLLDRVEVWYCGSIVREYLFGYREGTFGKTLLCNIVESYNDAAGNQLYANGTQVSTIHQASPYARCGLTEPENSKQPYKHIYHTFDYNELPDGKLFAQPVRFDGGWHSGPNLANVFSHLLYEHDNFGGSASAGFTVGGGINVGVGFSTWLKNITVGGHYAYNNDHNTSFMTLADINGDGYPDKLYRNLGGHLVCRLQVPGENRFGNPQPVVGVDRFNASSTSSHNWGVEASVCGGIGAGGNWSDSRSTTSIYLTDVNGDGLPDIVDNGSVYLNKGNLHFDDITDSDVIMVGGTCANDSWSFSGDIDPTVFDDGYYTVEREVCDYILDTVLLYDTIWNEKGYELQPTGTTQVVSRLHCVTLVDTIYYTFPRRYEPNVDLVRMWKAPYRGVVRIGGSAKLTDDLDSFRVSTRTDDGVWLSVHAANDTSHFIASARVRPGDVTPLCGYDTVDAGDTIYFRINSADKRLYDVVQWNPAVEYVSVDHPDHSIVFNRDATDANGDFVYRFDYGRDFMLDNRIGVTLGDTTSNTVVDTFEVRMRLKSSLPLAQSMRYSHVLRDYDNNAAENASLVDLLPIGQPVDTVYVDTLRFTSKQGLYLRLQTEREGQLRWSDIQTEATVTLLGSSSPLLRSWLADTAMQHALVFHPVVDRVYNDFLYLPGDAFPGIGSVGSFVVDAQVASATPIPVALTVKDENSTQCYTATLALHNGSNNITISGMVLQPNRRYHVDLYTPKIVSARKINRAKVRLNNQLCGHVGVYTKYAPDPDKHHGTLYRGWGQFGYKSPDSAAMYVTADHVVEPVYYHDTNAVIQPDDNYINNFDTSAVASSDNPELDMGGYLNPLASSFFEMTPNGQTLRWEGYGNTVVAARDYCSLDNSEVAQAQAAGIDGDAEISADMYQSPVPVVLPGQHMKAVNKQTMTKGRGYTVLMFSHSNNTTRLLGDFMDLNGDRYPDVVSEKEIHYSKAQGGLGSKKVGYAYAADDGINRSEGVSTGIAFNGTFLNAMRELKSNPKDANVVATVNGSHSPSPSGNALASTDHVENTFMDVNGDGLPDIVYDNHTVRYNMGYYFSLPRHFSQQFIRESSSLGASVGVSFNIGNTSISGGVGVNETDNRSDYALIDLNGDGLLDVVTATGIGINRGFGSNDVYSTYGIEHSHTQSFNANGGATYDGVIMIVWFPLKVGGSVNGGGSGSLSWTDGEYADMNNDGALDYVFKGPDGGLWVAYNNSSAVNLLKEVENFAGAKTTIGYTLGSSTPACPQRHWNMSSVVTYDGFDDDGENYMCRRFGYGERRYDRFERDDYGYRTTTTYDYESLPDYAGNHIYRTHSNEYVNSDYYNSHRKVRETTKGCDMEVETEWEYADADLMDGHYLNMQTPWCEGDGWPAVQLERTRRQEATGGTTVTECGYAYGAFGNVEHVDGTGDPSDPTDDYTVKLAYQYDLAQYIVSNVTDLLVPGYRHRMASYNYEGSLDQLKIENNPSPVSEYRYGYDQYGNVELVETPAVSLSTGGNYWIKYTYDNMTHSLPVEVRNAEGHRSSATYSLRWQKPLETTDIAGVQMRYSYDSRGRVDTIVAPMELMNHRPYTVRYDYWYATPYNNWPAAADTNHGRQHFFWARTRHYDREHAGNDICTMTMSDGLGRVVQVKKDVDTYGTEMRTVSGAVHYDGLGRTVRTYLPVSEPMAHPDSNFNLTVYFAPYGATEYDCLDRPVRVDYADGTSKSMTYTTDNDAAGIVRSATVTTDQMGNTTTELTDSRELKVEVRDAMGNTTLLRYDAVGQLQESIDPEGNSTRHDYDLGGRRIGRNHVSSGTTGWDYDAAGNMIRMTQNSGEQVEYVYDYNRPVEVRYSDRPWNNVYYEYGAAGSGEGAGRLVKQQDATGVMEMKYDCMGNTAATMHTYVQPWSDNTFTLRSEWEYDSWGRVRRIVYPDGENVIYSYDLGGNLQRVEGYKSGQPITTYLDKMHYDRFEQRVSLVSGNGVETRYLYNQLNCRLEKMENYSQLQNQLLQSNTYSYDAVGNVLGISDQGLNLRTQNYQYDNNYRLVWSEGDWNGGMLNYSSTYQYSAAGKITGKDVVSNRASSAVPGMFYTVNYNNIYHYPTTGNVFGVRRVSDGVSGVSTDVDWDANGNLTSTWRDEYNNRRLCWTEDNRLQGYVENNSDNGGSAAYYNYTAGGDRNLKFTSPRLNIQQNAVSMSNSTLVYPTLYASSLVTLNRNGYTKHYFEGENRICSKIGGGLGNIGWSDVDSRVEPVNHEDYGELCDRQHEGLMRTFSECLHHEAEVLGDYDLYNMLVNHEQGRNDYEPAFYYHSDHLGSAAYLTDDAGQETQTLNYLPYGEEWVDIQSGLDPNLGQYTFNGKEKDYESGLHYYGARYYSSELLTGWLSVDPMMDKYPSLSPYNYCAWNPVRLIDPDGCEAGDYYDKNGKWLFNDGIDDGKIYVEDQENGKYMGPLKQPMYREAGVEESVEAVFSGEATAKSNGTCGSEGKLEILQHCSDGNIYTRLSQDAISGPHGNGSIPNGDYTIYRGVEYYGDKGYVRDGVGFVFNLRYDKATSQRPGLEIHPDGNVPGTLGCIGLKSDAAQLKDFFNVMTSYIKKYKTVPLSVDINNNTNKR